MIAELGISKTTMKVIKRNVETAQTSSILEMKTENIVLMNVEKIGMKNIESNPSYHTLFIDLIARLAERDAMEQGEKAGSIVRRNAKRDTGQ